MSKQDQLKALGASTRARKNTPEASGKARKAPSRKAVSAPAPMTDLSRNSVRASPNPVAKATKGKTGTAGVKDPVRRSTTGTGLRVGAASAVLPATSEVMDVTAGETAPIRKPRFDLAAQVKALGTDSMSAPDKPVRGRGRPKVTGPRPWEAEGISKSTYYRDRKKDRL